MSIQWFASLVPLPTVITKPGVYLTRIGEAVTITVASEKQDFGCLGEYLNGGTDRWHKSGRLYFGQQSGNDIVRALDK